MQGSEGSRARSLYRAHVEAEQVESEFELLGRPWTLLPEVFSPAMTPVTALFTSWVPVPVDGAFLEVGCGAGVTAVTAALSGAAQVTALDISPAAVRNTALNAARHGVADRVHAVHSDLFDALAPDATYDVVYWNSNFTRGRGEAEPSEITDLERAFFDPGYEAHARYLREAPGRLRPGGRLLLGFASIGDRATLASLCDAGGLYPIVLGAKTVDVGAGVTFELLELVPTVAP